MKARSPAAPDPRGGAGRREERRVWRTDLSLRNPGDDPAPRLREPPPESGDGRPPDSRRSSFSSRGKSALSRRPDRSLFGLDAGSGAILLAFPRGAPRSTRRAGRTASAETAPSAWASAPSTSCRDGANFPVTFAAGLLGPGFRTNVVATDVSVHGVAMLPRRSPPPRPTPPVGDDRLDAASAKQRQLNRLADAPAPRGRRGSLVLTPRKGAVVTGLTAIDNATNDPTWFGPDLPATEPRSIPAVVHATGGNGARVPVGPLPLQPDVGGAVRHAHGARLGVAADGEVAPTLTLLPGESKMIRDALSEVFGLTGVAQVGFQTAPRRRRPRGCASRRAPTRRTPSGGTYGLRSRPLNAFQTRRGGESLADPRPRAGGAGFRTNLALVDLPRRGVRRHRHVQDRHRRRQGDVVDVFTKTLVPRAAECRSTTSSTGGASRTGPGPGLIRVSPSGGIVAAYATSIDNGTNDPLYAPPVLAAKP